jgi:hypothetical protein
MPLFAMTVKWLCIAGGKKMAPRLSILPGRFCEDARADIYHHRVIQALGRHTDNDGWCRVRQQVIADAISASRATVNRKLADLVHWGYVAKHAADTSGRSIFYRVIYDSPAIPEPHGSENDPDEAPDFIDQFELVFGGPVTDGLQAGYNSDADNGGACNPPVTPAVTPSSYTCCNSTAVTHNDPSQRSSSTTLPPYPPAERGGGESGVSRSRRKRRSDEIADLLADLRAERPQRARVLDLLLAPVVSQRRLDAPSLRMSLVALADWPKLGQQADAVLMAAAKHLLDTRKASVKPADIQEAIEAPHVQAAGQFLIRAPSRQWDAWLAYMRALRSPLVRHIESCTAWTYPTEWPPSEEIAA